MYKKTKIVATVSDMRCDVGFIQQLYDAGMNVVRLNTAHQDTAGMRRVINNVREVSSRIAILVDTKGPEVRTTSCAAPITFEKGDRVRIVGDPSRETTRECIAVSYPGFVHDMAVGAHILIDDGDLGLVVERKEGDCIECVVENAATLGARKSVNVPGVRVNLPALTERDKANIRFAIDADVAFIAHSFVRSREDVLEVRRLLDDAGSDIRIIAKIENQEGVDNIDEILDVADGIMVARGDLGVELPAEAIPNTQRRIVEKSVDGLERRRRRLAPDFEQKALHAPVSAPKGDRHALAGLGAADELVRHKVGVEPVGGIGNGRDCDASKHFLCHTVSPFALFKTYFAMCVSIFSAVSLPAATSLMAVVTGFSQRG